MNYMCTFASIGIMLFSLLWLLGLISLGGKWIFRKQKPTVSDFFVSRMGGNPPTPSKKITWSLVVIVALSLFLYDSATFRELVGIHTIEDLNDGTHCYYVEVSDGYSEYVLPGQISIDVQEYDDEYTRYYYIDRVYFSNGEYLDFSDDGWNYVTNINKYVRLDDQYGDTWLCKIINEHAYCPHVEETSYISVASVLEVVFVVTAVVYNWLGYIVWEEKQKENDEYGDR